MSWPNAFLEAVQTVCWTFIIWRIGAFLARAIAEAHNWDQRSK
jgi:hypothetical protein